MARLSHRGEAGDGDGASMLAAAPAPAGAVANPLADAPLRRRVSVARTAGGGAEQLGAAKVELDEELLRELARTVSPRQHRRFLLAQIGLLGLLVLVLVSMAVGAVMKLGELTAALDELSQIQEGIAGMATDLNSMANNVKSLKKMEKSLNGLSGDIGGMTDDIGRLSNLGGQIGDALGSGAGSAITSLAQGGIDTAMSALRGLIDGDDADGSDGGREAGDPAALALRATPCDPESANATALADCLAAAALYEDAAGAGGRRGGRNGGGGGFDWRGLLGGLLDGVGRVGVEVLGNVVGGGDRAGGNGGRGGRVEGNGGGNGGVDSRSRDPAKMSFDAVQAECASLTGRNECRKARMPALAGQSKGTRACKWRDPGVCRARGKGPLQRKGYKFVRE